MAAPRAPRTMTDGRTADPRAPLIAPVVSAPAASAASVAVDDAELAVFDVEAFTVAAAEEDALL